MTQQPSHTLASSEKTSSAMKEVRSKGQEERIEEAERSGLKQRLRM